MSSEEAIKHLDTLIHFFKKINQSLDAWETQMKEKARPEKAAA